MATVSELLRTAAVDYTTLAGESGLGRDVRRVAHAGYTGELDSTPGEGDLVVYMGLDEPDLITERPLLELLASRPSGLLMDVQPTSTLRLGAAASNTPLLLLHTRASTQTLIEILHHAATRGDFHVSQVQVELQQDLSDLAHAGASRTMVLQHLVEITGKTALLQRRTGLADEIRPAARQGIASTILKTAISATQADVESWIRDTTEEAASSILYWEVPAQHLVRLVAPIWVDGWTQAALSLFARPDELTSRDRMALLLTSRLLATLSHEPLADAVVAQLPTGRFPMATMAVRSHHSDLDAVSHEISHIPELRKGGLLRGPEDVRIWLPYRSVDEWNRLVHRCHAQLSEALGTVSIGHTLQRCGNRQARIAAIIQAAEAALIGDRLFGPGHVSSYAEAQLARLVLRGYDVTHLSAMYERAVGELAVDDPTGGSGLLETLEAYCETFATIRTAERLGIHRNTVVYRLKRIEEITATDLGDSATRLILQLGLLADRFLRKAEAIPERSRTCAAGDYCRQPG